MTKYPHLLSRGRMGQLELENRLIMAPMGSLNGDINGYVTERTINFYRDMAKGGVSMVIVESTYMDTKCSKSEENQLGLYENGQITRMRVLAQTIQDQGALAILQLCHIGHQISMADKIPSLGPSEMTEMMGGVIPFPIIGMTKEDIKQCIDDFAMAAWRAKMAGFDGVQIHGAIDHLLCMFCTPFYNRRTDEYGGTPENRIRFMKEIIEAVQEKCGKNFPIIARLCGCSYDPDGITLEEGIIHAKIIEKTGVACLHVIGGSNRNVRTINIQYDKRGDFLPIVKAFKEAGIKTPIIVDGGMTTPEAAEKVLEDGIADFIGIGRPMLADPDWILKIKEGRREDIVPCIRCCMGCVGTIDGFNAARGLRCSVNPTCNITDIRYLKPIKKKKRVCIVGGGPAGMEAARVLSLRGHEVTLYEGRKLGGMMNNAAFDPSFKDDISTLIDYFLAQMKKLPVDVQMKQVTAEEIIEKQYDAVVVASGSSQVKTSVRGEGQVRVHRTLDYTADCNMELGERVLVVGGCFFNAEIAYSIAKKGHKVILTTRRSNMFEVGNDNSSPMQQRLMALNAQHGVETKVMLDWIGIEGGNAKFKDIKNNEEFLIPCDDVILCRGFISESKIFKELEGRVPELYKAGDVTMKSRCVNHPVIGDAIEAGWVIGNRI